MSGQPKEKSINRWCHYVYTRAFFSQTIIPRNALKTDTDSCPSVDFTSCLVDNWVDPSNFPLSLALLVIVMNMWDEQGRVYSLEFLTLWPWVQPLSNISNSYHHSWRYLTFSEKTSVPALFSTFLGYVVSSEIHRQSTCHRISFSSKSSVYVLKFLHWLTESSEAWWPLRDPHW